MEAARSGSPNRVSVSGNYHRYILFIFALFFLYLFPQINQNTIMTIKIKSSDVVVTDRGGIVENRHLVHAAVVDSTGKLLFSVGDPTRMTLSRSAAKPIQALAVLETGGVDQFDFDDADLALMCASHNSEEKHVSRARAMLKKVNASESDLQCGGHAALSDAVNRAWIKSDYVPTAACSNCSGKHVGMLAGAKALGTTTENYHLPSHPIQIQVRRVFEELCYPDEKNVPWGLDGCNLPAPATSLRLLGKIYAMIAASVDNVDRVDFDQSSTDQLCTRSLGRIYHAMGRYPDLVAGESRFCTELIRAFQGDLIGKLGADGCYGIGIRESEQTQKLGAEGALGISVKIEDGNINMLYAAVAEVLEQLQIGTPEMRQSLEAFHYPKICNTVGEVTGHVSHFIDVCLT
jgi:L-asparaginase II